MISVTDYEPSRGNENTVPRRCVSNVNKPRSRTQWLTSSQPTSGPFQKVHLCGIPVTFLHQILQHSIWRSP